MLPATCLTRASLGFQRRISKLMHSALKLINPALFVLWGNDYGRFSGYRAFGLADSAANAEVFYHVGAFYQSFGAVKMADLFFLQFNRLGRGGAVFLAHQAVLIVIPGDAAASVYVGDANYPLLLRLHVQNMNSIRGADFGAESAVEFAVAISSNAYGSPETFQSRFQKGRLQEPP